MSIGSAQDDEPNREDDGLSRLCGLSGVAGCTDLLRGGSVLRLG
jgi:hypothetical protein